MAKQTKGKDTPTEPAVGTSVESLRERKRRETRAAIERSAITLVDELGYENVTVAMIAERAVVSQGTFFNYFPTKDAAIVGLGPLDLDPQAVHAAYDRLAPAAPYHATLSLFLEVVRETGLDERHRGHARTSGRTDAGAHAAFLGRHVRLRRRFPQHAGVLPGRAPRKAHLQPDGSTAAEEASLVVSEALEAAKFALARATKDLERGLPEADEVEAIVRKIVG